MPARCLIAILLLVLGESSGTLAADLVERQKLLNPSPGSLNRFGIAVSVSDDGSTVLVAALSTGMMPDPCVMGLVYVRDLAGAWQLRSSLEVPLLMDGDCPPHHSTDISSDGKVVVVGAGQRGYVYLFERNGGLWALQQTLTGDSYFGWDVALSGDANTLLVGAPEEPCAGSPVPCGGAYFFRREGGIWTEHQHFPKPAGGSALGRFGTDVELSADGTALISDPRANDEAGAAYVYVREGETWTYRQTLTPSPSRVADVFGIGMALKGDGSTAVVGASQTTGRNEAHVFLRVGPLWFLQQKLLSPAVLEPAGKVVNAVSGSGNSLLMGNSGRSCAAGQDCGAVPVFERQGSSWSSPQTLTASDAAAGARFGWSADLSGSAQTAVFGADSADGSCGNGGCGAAYVFSAACSELIDIFNPSCFELVSVPPELIYVGCEVVDCCPFCPFESVIDWVIRVTGDPFEALVLGWRNLPREVAETLTLDGAAVWIDDKLVIAEPGEVRLGGFPSPGRGLQANRLSPAALVESIAVERAAGGGPVPGSRSVSVTVDQYVGSVLIQSSSHEYRY